MQRERHRVRDMVDHSTVGRRPQERGAGAFPSGPADDARPCGRRGRTYPHSRGEASPSRPVSHGRQPGSQAIPRLSTRKRGWLMMPKQIERVSFLWVLLQVQLVAVRIPPGEPGERRAARPTLEPAEQPGSDGTCGSATTNGTVRKGIRSVCFRAARWGGEQRRAQVFLWQWFMCALHRGSYPKGRDSDSKPGRIRGLARFFFMPVTSISRGRASTRKCRFSSGNRVLRSAR